MRTWRATARRPQLVVGGALVVALILFFVPWRLRISGPAHLTRDQRDLVADVPHLLPGQHRVRRLPVVDGDSLAGIVTLDDIAVTPVASRDGTPELGQVVEIVLAPQALWFQRVRSERTVSIRSALTD